MKGAIHHTPRLPQRLSKHIVGHLGGCSDGLLIIAQFEAGRGAVLRSALFFTAALSLLTSSGN